jgi:cytochrome oxidase Cu insertion factor (SCO1/SenC/PrrC family)
VSMRGLRLALYIFAGFWFGGLVAFALFPQAREWLLPSVNVRSVGQALVGGPFTLTDQTGKRVTDQDYRGKFLLVFFGFTNCPDVCPTTLQVMAAALDKLGPNAERITPVLISVDPQHDTPALLASYVASFHPRLVGLTGSQAEIDAVAKAYRVYVKKVPDPKSTAGYTIDHSSIIYVMGPDGAYRAHFTHATSPAAMAERLAGMLQRPTM